MRLTSGRRSASCCCARFSLAAFAAGVECTGGIAWESDGKKCLRKNGKNLPGPARPLWLSRLSTRGAEDLRNAMDYRRPRDYDAHRSELEMENARLQKLVADLLTRNQQLRQALEAGTPRRDRSCRQRRDSCYSGTPLRTRHPALFALTLIAAASFASAPAPPRKRYRSGPILAISRRPLRPLPPALR